VYTAVVDLAVRSLISLFENFQSEMRSLNRVEIDIHRDKFTVPSGNCARKYYFIVRPVNGSNDAPGNLLPDL
jgi:hypothetical protein